MTSTSLETPQQTQPDLAISSPPSRWKRIRIRILIISVILLALLFGLEIFSRSYLGLGDPPLSISDPQIEYLFKPNQTCHRFGNLIHYNAYSMRSDDFPIHKSSPAEFRVMVIGDSVVNGGALTDQAQLASSLLQSRLSTELNRKVIVGNISAGSWGPPNQLAYIDRFGLFGADAIVIVISSHDYEDAPTFEPIVGVHPGFPDHKPFCATWEGLTRYLPGRLHKSITPTTNPATKTQAILQCSAALESLIQKFRASGAEVILVQHFERTELGVPETIGHTTIDAVAQKCNVQPLHLAPFYIEHLHRGQDPFRAGDNIHINQLGQKILADLVITPLKTIAQKQRS